MYTIANVVYGIPLHRNDEGEFSATMSSFDEDEDMWSTELAEAIDREDPGFMVTYRGGDTPSVAFGVKLGEFDEACHHTEVSTLTLTPSHEQMDEFNNLFNDLSDEVRAEINAKFGQPRVVFLWDAS